MIYFPNAKINLGLHVIEKRADGFHNLETVFYPIGLSDVMEVLPHPIFKMDVSGIEIDGNPDNNLCIKTYRLLSVDFDLPPIYIHLHKLIPLGAGLGGGSADAAFMLKALNEEFKLGLTNQQLTNYAACLGSDCAFFIDNQPAIATGRGEILHPVDVNLKGWYLTLVKPNTQVSTAEAYRNITPRKPSISLSEIIKMPVELWKEYMVNDFESGIFNRYPDIAHVKQQLYNNGAIYAAMSGSGSSVFGLFRSTIDLQTIFPDYFCYAQQL